eukprot:scaffold196499_cov29-Tisochrysis_lutea.AAC.2
MADAMAMPTASAGSARPSCWRRAERMACFSSVPIAFPRHCRTTRFFSWVAARSRAGGSSG